MVNFEPEIYLTDFLNREFAAKNAKNPGFGGGKKWKLAFINRSSINQQGAL
ncbi:MAG: hypothetical protein ACLPIX_22360 [Rhodomicrobium sp.]